MPKINSSLNSRIVVVLLASMVGMTLPAAEPKSRPQLVVGIVVEGLENDYLNTLSPYFTEGGFKRLMRDGMMITNADFGTAVDPLAASAMVMTGASPAVNGVGGDMNYDTEGHRLVPTMMDADYMGN